MQRRRVRPLLLVLLWVWALCVFLVVDLFLNVAAFDSVRPRTSLYRSMRRVAHDMVGEPCHDETGFSARRPPRFAEAQSSLGDALSRVQAAGSFDELRGRGIHAADARVRILALRMLADRVGRRAAPVLAQVARDADEPDKVRAKAACFLGRTGDEALGTLDGLLQSRASATVRAGALDGLAELGSPAAVELLVSIARCPPTSLSRAAVRAVGQVRNPAAATLLTGIVRDAASPAALRVAACRAPASPDAAVVAAVLADSASPTELKVAAAHALGRAGDREALPAIEHACGDADPEVALVARMARTRLEHVRTP
jgi:HEAT repeat protein